MIVKIANRLLFDKRKEGEILPAWYYGYAYEDIVFDYSVFAVVPLNWLIRWYREFVFLWNEFRGKPPCYQLMKLSEIHKLTDDVARREREAYYAGYAAAKAEYEGKFLEIIDTLEKRY